MKIRKKKTTKTSNVVGYAGRVRQRMSKAQMIAVAVLFAGVGTYAIIISFATEAPAGNAHLWVDTNGGSCTRSATPGSYSDGAACASIDAAWDAANAGDTIRIKAGTYGQQVVTGNKTSETYIIGENGTTFNYGATNCGYRSGALCANANFMTLQNVTLNSGNNHGQSSGSEVNGTNVTFRDVKLHGAFVSLYLVAPNFTWQRGSVGQDGTTGGARQTACDGGAGDGEPIWVESSASGATIDGIRFNPQLSDLTPVSCSSNGFHLENIRVQSAQNVTVKNSWFLDGSDAGSGHIFVTSASASATAATGFKLINNVFEPVNGSYAMQVHENVQNCDWYFAYNTWHQGAALTCNDDGITWVGNLGAYPGCVGTHIKNVWQRSSTFTCGSDKWVNGANLSVLGIGTGGQLASNSPAIDAGETNTASDHCTAAVGSVDREGKIRPAGSACDAGAMEYGASGGGSGPTANLWVDTNGGSCTRSASAAAYNDGQACGSFSAAYSAASPGDTVNVVAGTYGTQTIGVSTRNSPAVTFYESGGDVTLGGLDVSGDWATFNGFTVTGGVDVTGPGNRVHGVTFNEVNMRGGLYLSNSNQVTVNGGEVCCKTATPSQDSKVVNMAGQDGSGPQSANSNLTFDGVDIHDQARTDGSVHTECMFLMAVQTATIRNSHFYNCAVYNISIGRIGSDLDPSNILIENNIFEPSDDITVGGQQGLYSIVLDHVSTRYAGLTFKNNSFASPIQLETADVPDATGYDQTTFVGNILRNAGQTCAPAGMTAPTYSHNVMDRAGGCGSNSTIVSDVRTMYENYSAGDFHLKAGAAAIGAGSPTNYTATDREGNARDSDPDAGAYEYAGGGAGPGPDTTPPSNVSGMTFTATNQTSISVDWNAATDNVGVAGYRMYLNNSPVTTTANTDYTFTGLTCGTTYTIAIEPYDAAGNVHDRAEATGTSSTAACGSTTKTGDLNSDNNVNIFDLSILLSNYGKTRAQSSPQSCDINNDGNVNIFDLSVLLSNYGK